jgi:MFS family permease
MADTSGWANIAKAFSNRHYRMYQLGRFFSLVTLWMYRVAVGWLVWEMTESSTWLGIFGFLDQAPAILILPFAGAQADRMDCLRYMRITQTLLLIKSLLLAILVGFDVLNIWILAVFVLFHGIVNAAQQPASQAVLPDILEKEYLTAAYGLNSLTFNVSRFIGPMIAGPVIYAWGTAPAIFANAVGAALFSFCLASMRSSGKTFGKRSEGHSKHMLTDIRDGFAYATRHPGIRPSMVILAVLSVFAFSIDNLLPSLADGIYKEGAQGLAWMSSVMGLGAMVLALSIARRGGIAGLTGFVVRAILISSLAFALLWLADNIWLGLLGIFIIGYGASATRVGLMTLLQSSVDSHMRGRVASIYSLINQSGPAVGALAIGWLGDRFGIDNMMGIAAAVTIVMGVWAFLRRERMAAALEIEPAAPRKRAAE